MTKAEQTARGSQAAMIFIVIYTILLALGTAGELLDIGWIKDLPIFRGP